MTLGERVRSSGARVHRKYKKVQTRRGALFGLVLAVIALAANFENGSWLLKSAQAAPTYTTRSQLPLFPDVLRLSSAKSIELGDLIRALMPSQNEGLDWGWGSNTGIVWLDSGYTSIRNESIRRGVARVNVLGEISTVLKTERFELGRLVTLSTTMPAKFGPQAVTIAAGLDYEYQCFGSLYSGCAFDVLPSLRAANVEAKEVCKRNDANTNGFPMAVYLLSSNGKALASLLHVVSGGSGGVSSYVRLWFTADYESVCRREGVNN